MLTVRVPPCANWQGKRGLMSASAKPPRANNALARRTTASLDPAPAAPAGRRPAVDIPRTTPMRAPSACFCIAALAAALLSCRFAHAEEEVIATDRPDFVESSDVVGLGHFQLEAGLTSDRHSRDGSTTRTLTTPTLFRYGIGDTTELRLETDGYTHERTNDGSTATSATARGWSDLSLGIKWHVLDGKDATPGVAWLLHVDTATGSRAFRGAGLRPSLRAAVEWDLPHEFSLGVMPGLYVDRNEAGKRYAGAILATTLGKAWSPRWHSFVEIAGQQLASRRNGGSVVTLDAGLAFVATPTLQFDVEASRGLTHEAPDVESGIGVSLKF
ncbi:MAG: transporter [Vitreoscilla sp.]